MSYAMYCTVHGPRYESPCSECGRTHSDPVGPPMPRTARAVLEGEIRRRADDLRAILVREANAPRTEQWAACVRSLLLYGGHTDECEMFVASVVSGVRKSDDCTCGWNANHDAARALLERA